MVEKAKLWGKYIWDHLNYLNDDALGSWTSVSLLLTTDLKYIFLSYLHISLKSIHGFHP